MTIRPWPISKASFEWIAKDILGIKQPHVLALMRNRSGNCSVGRRLMEFLTALGQDVRITVKPTRKAKGEMAVVTW